MSTIVKKLPGGASADAAVQGLLDAGFAPKNISVVGSQGELEGPTLMSVPVVRWLMRAVILCAIGGVILGVIEALLTGNLIGPGGLSHAFTGAGGAIAGLGLGGLGLAAFGPVTAMMACATEKGDKGHVQIPSLGPGEVAIVVDAGQRDELARTVLDQQYQSGYGLNEALAGPRRIPAIASH